MSITTFFTNSPNNGTRDEIILLYSKGFEHGPGINRDGMGEPWMEDRFAPERPITDPVEQRRGTWLIDNQQANSLERELITQNEDISQTAKAEWLRELDGTPNYFDQFAIHYPDYEIVGMQGNGNLTMNLWFTGYLNSRFTSDEKQFLHLYDEKPAGKQYSCLVKWLDKSPLYSIEDLRFDVDIQRVRSVQDNSDITDQIEFAVFGQRLVDHGELADFGTIATQFADIRHLYRLPNINPGHEFGPDVLQNKPPRMLFMQPREHDVWFGERQMTRSEYIDLLIHALTEPVLLDRNFDGMGAMSDLLRATFARDGYREVLDATIPPRARGEWRVYSDRMVQIYLQRNVYAYTMIGINSEGNIIAAAAGGQAGRIGQTLEAMAQNMVSAGCRQVLLIDEGNDVFQWTNGQYTVPPRRGRIRSVFVFARKKE